MKGIFVINSLSGGGAEKVFSKLLQLVDSDQTKNYSLEVVVLDRDVEVYQLPSSVSVHYIDSPLGVVGQILKFIRLVQKSKPDFVVSFLFRSNWYNVIAAKLFGYKSIISERGSPNARLTGKFVTWKKALIRSVYRQADAIICVSKGVGDCLVDDYSVNPSKIKTLNNSYDFNDIAKRSLESETVSNHEGYILAIGRLVKLKGFDDLITAYAKSNIQRPLLILGDGDELENLKQHAIELGVQDRVAFPGFVSNPYPYMKKAFCFALTSHSEGFPNAMVESMSLGVPIISSMTDGPIDILEPSANVADESFSKAKFGLVFNPRDIEGLQKAFKELESNHALYNELAVLSEERAQNYSECKFYSTFKQITKDTVPGIV